MEESFYVTVSSNVNTDYFPDNKLTHFFNRLQTPLNLHNQKWVVGLAEIQCPFNWKDVQEGECYCTLLNVNSLLKETCYIAAGHYAKNRYLIHYLNDAITNLKDEDMRDNIFFKIDVVSGKVVVELPENILISFSPKLTRILGFESTQPDKINSKYKGRDVMDINDGFHHLFVYTNLIEARPVGDTIAPLLRIIPVLHAGGTVNKINSFNNVHYLPVKRQIFESVEIDIRDGTGDNIPFERGSILITLHFKFQNDSQRF